jgi:hypothetical protein
MISHVAKKVTPDFLLNWYASNKPMGPHPMTSLAVRFGQQLRNRDAHRTFLRNSDDYFDFLEDVYKLMVQHQRKFDTHQFASILASLPPPKSLPPKTRERVPPFFELLSRNLSGLLLGMKSINSTSQAVALIEAYTTHAESKQDVADLYTEFTSARIASWFVQEASPREIALACYSFGKLGLSVSEITDRLTPELCAKFTHPTDIAKLSSYLSAISADRLGLHPADAVVDTIATNSVKSYGIIKMNQTDSYGKKVLDIASALSTYQIRSPTFTPKQRLATAAFFGAVEKDSQFFFDHFRKKGRANEKTRGPASAGIAALLTTATQSNFAMEEFVSLVNDNAEWVISNALKSNRGVIVARLALALAAQPYDSRQFWSAMNRSNMFETLLINHSDHDRYPAFSEELSTLLLALAHSNEMHNNSENVGYLWSLVCDRANKNNGAHENSAAYLRSMGEFHFLAVSDAVELERRCIIEQQFFMAFQKAWHRKEAEQGRTQWHSLTSRRVVDRTFEEMLGVVGFAMHEPSGAHDYLGLAWADYEKMNGIVFHDVKQYYVSPTEIAREAEEEGFMAKRMLGGVAMNKERLLRGGAWHKLAFVGCHEWDAIGSDEDRSGYLMRLGILKGS